MTATGRVEGEGRLAADARTRIPAFVERVGVTYPIYCMSPSELAKVFATPDIGLPLSILIDDQGRVMDVFEGWSAKTRQRLDRLTQPSLSP